MTTTTAAPRPATGARVGPATTITDVVSGTHHWSCYLRRFTPCPLHVMIVPAADAREPWRGAPSSHR